MRNPQRLPDASMPTVVLHIPDQTKSESRVILFTPSIIIVSMQKVLVQVVSRHIGFGEMDLQAERRTVNPGVFYWCPSSPICRSLSGFQDPGATSAQILMLCERGNHTFKRMLDECHWIVILTRVHLTDAG